MLLFCKRKIESQRFPFPLFCSITLAIGLMKTDEQWLDRFVKMEEKWISDAKGWVDYMDAKYRKCGRLDKWDEDVESWPELTEEEKEAINKCTIM